MKTFNVPIIYRSPLISAVKQRRKQQDKMKKDFTPTLLDLGNLHIYLARHFGFCYGVENAIEIAFRIAADLADKRCQPCEGGVAPLSPPKAKLLAKIEELTLHMIQAESSNRELRDKVARLESQVSHGMGKQ